MIERIYNCTISFLAATVIFLVGVLVGYQLVIKELGPVIQETATQEKISKQKLTEIKGNLEATEGLRKGKGRLRVNR